MIENLGKNNKGITLLILVVTVIVLMIIVGTVVKYGMQAITYATYQSTKTNMLLVEAKAKEYVENANFQLGVKPEEATDEMKQKARSELKGTLLTHGEVLGTRVHDIGISPDDVDNGNVFKLTKEDLEAMNIHNVESNDDKGWYIIVYNIEAATVKIYHTYGVRLESKEIKYCLDDIRDINL